jgi:plastocyanin
MTKRLLGSVVIASMMALALFVVAMAFAANSTQAEQSLAANISGAAAQSTAVAKDGKAARPDGVWTDVAPFPTVTIEFTPQPQSLRLKRAGAAAYPPNGNIYILGGRHGVDGEDWPLRWIWQYTPGNPGTITQKAALLDGTNSTDRYTANMAVVTLTDTNGVRIYAIGGNSVDTIATPVVRVYNPVADTVTTLTTDPWPASPVRVPGGWAVHNNKLYIFGGFTAIPSNQVFSDTWRFDPMAPAGTRWTQLPTANLSVPRAFIAGATLDGFIYAIGGDGLSGGNLTSVTTVERMDPNAVSPVWTTVASLPTARGDMGAWAYDTGTGFEISGHIAVAGGKFPVPDAVGYEYYPPTNTWSAFPSLNHAVRNYGYAQLNGFLYTFGGYDYSGGLPNGTSINQRYDATGPAVTPSPIGSTTPSQTATATATTCASNSNYAVSTATATFVNTGTLIPGTQCQSCVIPYNLPFPVQFYDRTFTQAFLSAHGNIQFLSGSTSDINRCLPWNGMNYAIMPFWDLGTTQSGGQGIFSQVSGAAGSRTLTIQWRSTGGSFEVRFFENSRNIEFVYGTVTGGGNSATIGLQKDTGSLFLQHSCNTSSVTNGTRLIFTIPACNVATVTGTPPTNTPVPTSTPSITAGPTNTAGASITPGATATVCGVTTLLTEGFEAGTLGAFTNTVFITSTTTPVPTPGWASIAANPHSGTRSAFAPDPDRTTDSRLTTLNNITVPAGASQATLSFWHRFGFENLFDGGVLEVSTDGGTTWTDADANITQGGYNGTITVFQGCVTAGTPPPFASGQRVWTSSQANYTEVRVNLLPYAGTTMKFRFRLGTDCSVSNTGWNIDDVVVTVTGGACGTGTPISTPQATNTPSCNVTNVVVDGSFEGGSPSSTWTEKSTNFGTPLCNDACGSGGGTAGPRTGDWWAWFGGTTDAEDGAVSQTVNIPAGGATLSFYLWLGAHSGGGTGDFLRVLVGGTEVFRADDTNTEYDAGYTLVTVPVAATGSVILRFEEHNEAGTGVINFSVDDVSLNVGGGCGTPVTTSTAVASATVAATVTGTPCASALTEQVDIIDFAFAPEEMTIHVGDTINWTNTGSAPHTSTSDSAMWDSGSLSTGDEFSFTFNAPGTYTYHCEIHTAMTGTITVLAGCAPTATATTVPATATLATTQTSVPSTGTPAQATSTTIPGATSTTVPPTVCPLTFSDVPSSNTFYVNIRCLVCRGIISGYSDGTFRPNNDITRGQISKIVSQSAGFSEPAGTRIYEDVPEASPFFTWIQRLSHRGLVGGYPCGLVPGEPCILPGNRPYFRPNASATRGQLSKIVASAKGITTTPTGETYQDVSTSHTFYVWIEQLSNLGVMGGYPCGTMPSEPCGTSGKPYFRPNNNVTRGQASKIVANTFFPNCVTPGPALDGSSSDHARRPIR